MKSKRWPEPPRIFTVQLLFIYRYIFVLINEASRMANARALRSFGGKGMGIKVFNSLLGHLLLRTLEKAQRIHLAMLCRGFDGEIKIQRRLNIGTKDVLYSLAWSAFFILMRTYNISQLTGKILTKFFL